MRFHPAFIPALLSCLTGASVAQVEWREKIVLEEFLGPVAADLARSRLVLLGSPSGLPRPRTWEWDGTAWNARQPASSPPFLGGRAMAYDLARGRTVLFTCQVSQGFPNPTGQSHTWEWNGTDWFDRAPAVMPIPRLRHAMAFDLLRNRVVLFGGEQPIIHGTSYLGDTWEWDGNAWTQLAPAASPPARSGHAMAYDLAQGNVVLFGGSAAAGSLGDTWTFDGVNWTQRAPVASPPARSLHGMAPDIGRGRIVLFGGGVGPPMGDTWEWDGSTWSQASPVGTPGPRSDVGLASDPTGAGVLLASGRDGNRILSDLWRFDGTQWTRLADRAAPQPRHSHALAFDEARSRLVVFGGVGSTILGDHWAWDGVRWTQVQPGVLPPARTRGVMVFDSLRGRVVLFGGELPGFANDTWEWDGVQWTQPATPIAPSARILHGMAFDRQRGRVVLFGGVGTGFLGDTWEWNGTQWTQLTPAVSPPPRHSHTLAFDEARGVTVLFGGLTSGVPFGMHMNDTWEWDGSIWTFRTPPVSPSPRSEFAMGFDPLRRRVVVFGGWNGGGTMNDSWEWTGTTWLQRTTSLAPPLRIRHRLAFDPALGRTLMFGGQSMGPNFSDLWEYGPVFPAAVTAFGNGCAGTAGVPVLGAAPGERPWLQDTVTLVVEPVPAAAFALFWAGSSTFWGATPLPFPLGPLGLPGCTMFVGIDVNVLVAASAGRATLALAVPPNPILLGVEVHMQAAATDPPANAFGAVVSNAVTLRVGGR